MTTQAILLVSNAQLVFERVGGLSVLERQLFTIARAGVKKAWITTPKPPDGALAKLRLPPDLEIVWSGGQAATPAQAAALDCRPPYLALSGNHFIRVETLRYVVEAAYAVPVAIEDASGSAVLQVIPSASDQAPTPHKQPLPAGASVRVERPVGRGPALRWLLATATKSQDGFMARNFDRHISLAVSRQLLDTRVTPNAMTASSSLIGLLGAACFLGSGRPAHLSGALLVWLHSVLDGCDGELARMRFEESAFGSDLDFWSDNLVHLALFSALGAGFWLAGRGAHALALSAMADACVVASAWMAWQHRLSLRRTGAVGPEAGVTAQVAGGGTLAALSRLENALAQRDFIYLLILLAYAGFLYEFLWAGAVGSLLYFGIMLYLRRVRENEQAPQLHPAR